MTEHGQRRVASHYRLAPTHPTPAALKLMIIQGSCFAVTFDAPPRKSVMWKQRQEASSVAISRAVMIGTSTQLAT
jgi:hypothetical protein